MGSTFVLVVIIVVVALIFDFLNGFHDAANTITTAVVTKTLSPLWAVLIAGLGNFVGYFIFGVAVAETIGKGIIHVEFITLTVLLSALFGAVLWNVITWLLGLPTSSSHALIGGLVGAGVASFGIKAVYIMGVLKIVLFIFIAPAVGLIASALFSIIIMRIFRKVHQEKANKLFKRLIILSSLLSSIGHGTNDAQKSMGIIALALFAGKVSQSFHLDSWIVLSCYIAIALGTMFGGWRIVKTMGTKITKIYPMDGFSSGVSASIVMIGTAEVGIPVSTTHVIAGSIMGVGAVRQLGTVRWITARKIVWAWIMTIPITASFSFICYTILSFFIKI